MLQSKVDHYAVEGRPRLESRSQETLDAVRRREMELEDKQEQGKTKKGN